MKNGGLDNENGVLVIIYSLYMFLFSHVLYKLFVLFLLCLDVTLGIQFFFLPLFMGSVGTAFSPAHWKTKTSKYIQAELTSRERHVERSAEKEKKNGKSW